MQKQRVFWASVFANLLTLLLLPEIAHAQVTVSCPPTTGGTYPSITAALNAVGQIGPLTFTVTGTCNENVTLDRAQSLRIIAGAGGAKIVAPQDSDAFDIFRSQFIRLVNLEITGAVGAGVFITQASNVQINGCDIHDNQGGVGVATHSLLSLTNTNIHNNNPLDGLAVFGGSTAAVSGSTIQNNGSPGELNNPASSVTGGAGVFVGPSSIVNFGGNSLIQSNAEFGIVIRSSGTVGLQGAATIQGHDIGGIVVTQGGHLHVDFPALIQGNGGGCPPQTPIPCGGIVGTANATLELNTGTISGNHGAGIFVQQGTNLHLNGATISNNSGDGVHIQWISTADFRVFSGGANTITGNGGASVFCDSRSLVIGDLTGFSKVNCGQTSQ